MSTRLVGAWGGLTSRIGLPSLVQLDCCIPDIPYGELDPKLWELRLEQRNGWYRVDAIRFPSHHREASYGTRLALQLGSRLAYHANQRDSPNGGATNGRKDSRMEEPYKRGPTAF